VWKVSLGKAEPEVATRVVIIAVYGGHEGMLTSGSFVLNTP
jgi:hypothetical protein